MADGTIGVKTGSLGATSMRYHELALQRWLNRLFIVREGYPVPVVFATPMDAFSQFTRLWSAANNPFQYLLQAVDEEGTPLYQPYPAPVRYPLLSVYRKGFKYRSYQNFSIHKFRHINWPTISDDVGRCDLGNVTTSKMPMAWDYKFQLDFFCNRPDTQAFFVEKLMREFYKTGGTPQTWIAVEYPAWGRQLIRVYIDGDIENNTPEEPEADKNVEFRTTVNIVVEGFSLDLDFKIEPAFWTLIFGTGSIDPVTLQRAFEPLREDDVRIRDNNVTMLARSNLPADTVCQEELNPPGQPFTKHVYIGNPDVHFQQSQGGLPYWPLQPGFPGGIPSSAAFGVASVSQGTVPVIPSVDVSGTESGGLAPGFQVGSLVLAPWTEVTTEIVTFGTGDLNSVIASGGTVTDTGSQYSFFGTGDLTSAIVNGGTNFDFGTFVPSFGTGWLTQVIVSGGTNFENGTEVVSFGTGDLTLVAISTNGTEVVTVVPAFFSGSLALA
jgi:hypothetical protein